MLTNGPMSYQGTGVGSNLGYQPTGTGFGNAFNVNTI